MANLLTHASFSAPDLPITLYLGGGDYHFTYPGDAAHPRLPPIFGNVILHGNGATLHLHGSNTESPADRLVIGQTGSLHLHHLHLKAGRGRAIVNYGTLHLTDSSLANDLGAPDYYLPDGGGIENRGTLTLTRSRLARNRLLTETTPGGALANYGTLEATCTIFEDNRAAQGGALWNALGGTLHVSHSRFSGNQANGGGALYNADTSGASLVEGYFGGGLPTIDDLYFGTDTLSQRVTYSVSSVDYTLAAGCAAAAPVPPPTNVTVLPAGSSAPPPEIVPIEGVAEGRIVFSSNKDGYAKLYTAKTNGTDVRRLTTANEGFEYHPDWSWNDEIIYISYTDKMRLKVVNADGSNNRSIVLPAYFDDEQNFYARWSPQSVGRKLVLTTQANNVGKLYVIDLDSDPVGVTLWLEELGTSFGMATWSPDGSRIIFSAFYSGYSRIQQMSLPSGLVTTLASTPNDAFVDSLIDIDWFPNSEALLINNFQLLLRFDLATNDASVLAPILSSGGARLSRQQQILYTCYTGQVSTSHLCLIDSSNWTTIQLTEWNGYYTGAGAWSPDACVGYKYGTAPNIQCRIVAPNPPQPNIVSIYRPSDQTFYLRYTQAGLYHERSIRLDYALSGDIPVVGDWDGDGYINVGVYRPSSAQFLLTTSEAAVVCAPDQTITYGTPGALPLAGKWTVGATADSIGVWHGGVFSFRQSLTDASTTDKAYGNAADTPLVGNWVGDGVDRPAVWRNGQGMFYLDNNDVTQTVLFGSPNDTPLAGDWDGNGIDGVGVWREGMLYLTNTLSGVGEVYQTAFYGLPSDVAVVGVWRELSADEVPPPVVCAVPTATPTLNIQQLINELATYGVLAYAQGSEPAQDPSGIKGIPWTQPELEQILSGVQGTAGAFLRIKTQLGQYQEPKSLFRKIMGEFKVVHVVNGFQHVDPNGQPVQDGCDNTTNAGCTTNDRGAILFYGNFYQSIEIIQYTMVHELGHRFDNRSNIPESNESISERMDSGETVLDCGYPFIPTVTPGGPTLTSVPTLTPGGPTLTPTKPVGLVMGENLVIQPWTRGERGWGSGPARQPNGGYLITDFQQNPAFISSSVSKAKAVGEATADMFLNWVYRGGSDYLFAPCLEDYPGTYLSFRNEDWRNMTSHSAISGTPDNTKPGAKRQSWFENIMGEIFATQVW